MNKIVLKVNGKSYEGWTGISIIKSLNQMSGSFGLTSTDIYPSQPYKWKIGMGNECSVEINDQKIITGYIEDIIPSYSEETHTIQFGGRDKTGDLIDCSFDDTNKEWKGLNIKTVIEKICDPFNISVVVDNTVLESVNEIWPDNIKANEGDTAFDLINKIGKMKGFLPITYGDGNLTLTRAGTGYKINDVLETGKNIKAGLLNQSDKDRFNTYIVKGQGVGNDFKTDLLNFTSPVGRIEDNVIDRYRPIIIFTETTCDSGRCLEKAKWEMNTRAGKSRSLNYTIRGWTQSNGEIWPLNSIVQVRDTKLNVNSSLLISGLNFTVNNEGGTITKMILVHPNTFSLEPTAPDSMQTSFDLNKIRDLFK